MTQKELQPDPDAIAYLLGNRFMGHGKGRRAAHVEAHKIAASSGQNSGDQIPKIQQVEQIQNGQGPDKTDTQE